MLKAGDWRHTLCVTLGAAALLAPLGASAQSGADDWKFRATLYGWLPDIKGTSNFPPLPGSTGNTQVDASQILDSLQGVFMGTLEARKGRWGAITDVIYLDLSNGKTGVRPFTVGGALVSVPGDAVLTADLEIKGWLWTLAAEYAAIQTPTYEMNVLGGFRYLTLDQNFNFAFTGNIGPIALPLRAGALSADEDVWDAIIGVHGRAKLGNEGWFLPYYLDIGTGGSNLTWQAMAGVGYEFKWGNVILGYRYLDYDLSDSKAISDLSLYGGMIGVTFHW